MRFNTTQSDLIEHNEKKIVKRIPLDESKYDKEDVGPMFIVTLSDGTELHAFEDECQMKYDDFNGYKRILKSEARKRFERNEPVFIGGKQHCGEGAIWEFTQFKMNKLSSFNEVSSWFKRHYCTGVGKLIYVCFYIEE